MPGWSTRAAANLLKMINQIMDLTKISAGRYELQRGAVDAGGLLWLVREAFAARAEDRGITIDADRCPDRPDGRCRRGAC